MSLLQIDKIIKRVKSDINNEIVVKKSLGLGIYIQVNNLTQSGKIVSDIWDKVLRKISKRDVNNILILGLGGGSVAILAKKHWPQAYITGVEIDPVMVKVGKKYLGLDEIPVDILIEDADIFLNKSIKNQTKFDLIIVDMYIGDTIPERFNTQPFVKKIKRLLSKNGAVCFNRLYSAQRRKEAIKYAELLEKEFANVGYIYPHANLVLVCFDF